MKFHSIALALVLPAVSLAFGDVTPSKDAPLFPTRNNLFTIPFEIKVDDSSDLPAEVELTYSTDHGMNWYPYGRVQPDKKQFLFKSPADGEYWFIFKTYGQDGLVKETRRRGPMLRVLVDTIPPKLSLSAEQKSTGEIAIQWSVEDANLNRKSPQLQISYTVPDQKSTYLSNWKPVAIDPSKTQSEGNTHQGELIIWPERDAVSFEIQGEIVDAAGNREMQSRTVTLTTIAKATDSNVLTESMQAELKRASESKPKPLVDAVPKLANPTVKSGPLALKSSNPSLVPPRPQVLGGSTNRSPDKGPIANLNDLNEAIRNSKEKRPTDLDEEIPDFSNITSPKYANDAGKNAGKDSVLIGPLLFSEDTTKDSFSVGSPQAPVSAGTNEAIEFPLEEPKPESEPESALPEEEGLKLAPLNPKYSETPADVSPPVLDDIAASENETAKEPEEKPAEEAATAHPPVQSDKIAEQLAEKTSAQIRITKVSHMRDLKLSQILVKWETELDSWPGAEKAKVHLFRGPTQQGPWTPIATEQENLGSYAWTVSQEDRNPFYILLQCENESKEVVSDLTMQPIQLPASLFGGR